MPARNAASAPDRGSRASDSPTWADAQPHELSAGMRQRAALARALACEPDVVLGDEPFGVLDAQTRELLQNEVQRAWMGSGGRTTFLFITHNVREAVLLADRVLVMSARPGRLLEEFRIHAPRPRDLDDVLVGRVVSEIHALLLHELEGPDAWMARTRSCRRSPASSGSSSCGRLLAAATTTASIPSPLAVWDALVEGLRAGTIQEAALKTLIRLAFSFVVAVVLGAGLGVLLAFNEFLRRAIRPLIVALQITPFVAWVPLAVVWFGVSERAVVFVTIVGSFPAMALATLQAIRQVPPLYERAGRTLGALAGRSTAGRSSPPPCRA